MVLAYIPMQVALTYLAPHNCETSTMALISGTFIWSYEVGAKMSTSLLCLIFEVDEDHMDRYPHILLAKLPLLLGVMLLTVIIPTNEEISERARILREDHHRRLVDMDLLTLE